MIGINQVGNRFVSSMGSKKCTDGNILVAGNILFKDSTSKNIYNLINLFNYSDGTDECIVSNDGKYILLKRRYSYWDSSYTYYYYVCIYFSNDYGNSFTVIESSNYVYDLLIAMSEDGKHIIYTFGDNIYVSEDYGDSFTKGKAWRKSYSDGNWYYTVFSPNAKYIATYDYDCIAQVSNDYGKTYNQITYIHDVVSIFNDGSAIICEKDTSLSINEYIYTDDVSSAGFKKIVSSTNTKQLIHSSYDATLVYLDGKFFKNRSLVYTMDSTLFSNILCISYDGSKQILKGYSDTFMYYTEDYGATSRCLNLKGEEVIMNKSGNRILYYRDKFIYMYNLSTNIEKQICSTEDDFVAANNYFNFN